jgi:hypothetical protein
MQVKCRIWYSKRVIRGRTGGDYAGILLDCRERFEPVPPAHKPRDLDFEAVKTPALPGRIHSLVWRRLPRLPLGHGTALS